MELHISLAAETLFHIGPIPVTNSMLVMFVVMALILIVFSYLARTAQAVPGRAQGVAELIVEFLLNLVESTAGKRIGRRIFPLVAGLFIFILFSNFTGLLPGVGTITVDKEETAAHADEDETLHVEASPEATAADHAVNGAEEDHDTAAATTAGDSGDHGDGEEAEHAAPVPILRPPTADLNMTLAMSLLTFTVVQVAGVSAHGFVGRIKHMADPPFLFPIEVISELSRIISLSARLFGNVFAGEVLLGVMYAMSAAIKVALIPVLFPVVFIGLEVLFGTIQALVFALLTLIYIYLAAAGHDDHGESDVERHDTVRAVDDAAPDAGHAPAPAGD
jgi:F-type H+-transporting ATPase subunit a